MDTKNMNTIKIFTLFSGYDSQLMGIINAVKNSKKHFDVELVGWSDIDPDVQRIHNLTFPEYADRCYPDVTKIVWELVHPFDVLFYSIPALAKVPADLAVVKVLKRTLAQSLL